ncbi:hypothetical protein IFT47_20480 [Pseudomonas sp. CFBP 13711]|uniref:hypothetical protein n=1 Tax=unclassified Pseudomonas TaxID=196821 RepID=UPI00177AB82D|nr:MULTISPECIES: hypothetical protein [unclassified Pseudomonas]MBD8709011.1 hypothetical protein [Pseudomonas sp. CFBP 13711]MBD8715052.1 hypothetical protein [Pseudomonas sp. CFBP 13715]
MSYVLVAQTHAGQCCGSCIDLDDVLAEAAIHQDNFLCWLVLDPAGQVVFMSVDRWFDDVQLDAELVAFAQENLN